MACGCLTLRMPKVWASAIGLWQTLFFSCLVCHIGAPEVPELQCHTDFATEVVCYWGVNNATNCTEEFLLRYDSSNTEQRLECDLWNRRILESASPSCVCEISEEQFMGTKYTFLLESRRNNMSRNRTIDLEDIVKPRALRNLSVSKSKRRSFILTWRKDYDSSNPINIPGIFYQVRISSEDQKQTELKSLTEQVEHYEIFADTLLPGKSYNTSVRYKIDSWKSFWSEWSVPCKWYNDFKPEGGNWWVILLACFLVMVLISTCYLCLARLKRAWWDDIPSADKSHLGKESGGKLSLEVPKMFLGAEGEVSLCVPSQGLLEWQRSVMYSHPKDGAAFPSVVPGSSLGWEQEPFFTPEVPAIEPSLTICSRLADAGPEAPTEEEGDHVPHTDAFVVLFLEILGDEGHAQDAKNPACPVLEEYPSTRAPEQVLGDFCPSGSTPRKSLVGSSESGRLNNVIAASPQAASPAPEQHQGDTQSFPAPQNKWLLFPQTVSRAPCQAIVTAGVGPQADCPGGGRATTPQPSCYKSFNSLLCPSTASSCQLWEHQPALSRVDQSQPHGSFPSSFEAAALLFPPQQEATSQKVPGIPCTLDSCLPGYRPFGSALPPRATSPDPSWLRMGSPYKPCLGVLSIPQEAPLGPILRTQEAQGEAGQRAPLEEPDLCF